MATPRRCQASATRSEAIGWQRIAEWVDARRPRSIH
jgi:hypothetical protein